MFRQILLSLILLGQVPNQAIASILFRQHLHGLAIQMLIIMPFI